MQEEGIPVTEVQRLMENRKIDQRVNFKTALHLDKFLKDQGEASCLLISKQVSKTRRISGSRSKINLSIFAISRLGMRKESTLARLNSRRT